MVAIMYYQPNYKGNERREDPVLFFLPSGCLVYLYEFSVELLLGNGAAALKRGKQDWMWKMTCLERCVVIVSRCYRRISVDKIADKATIWVV